MKNLFRRWLCGIVSVAALFFPVVANAFTISPIRYSLVVDPGSSQVLRLKIKNTDDTPATYVLGIRGATQDDLGRTVWNKDIDPAERWITAEVGSVRLAPGEERSLAFTVRVPAGSPSTFHMVGLLVESKSSAQGTVMLRGQLVSLVGLQVAGSVTERMSIENWAVDSRALSRDWNLHVRLKNQSNGSVPVAGQISIKNIFGKVVWQKSVSMGNAMLPQSVRELAFVTDPPQQVLAWPGVYTTELRVTYGLTNQQTQISAPVWYFPWYSVVIAVLIVLYLGIVITQRIRRPKIHLP